MWKNYLVWYNGLMDENFLITTKVSRIYCRIPNSSCSISHRFSLVVLDILPCVRINTVNYCVHSAVV